MAKLSRARAGVPLLAGLELLSRGKVRDSYRLPNRKRLVVTTDGISARDYVLDALISMKGIILNTMTVFWLKMLEQHGVKHHMVAFGSAIDEYLPEALRGNIDLQSRAMVVEDLPMDEFEGVVRKYLAGSAIGSYQQTGEICGQKLPPGLQPGDKLPCTKFTPTTKAQEGHDENVPAEEIIRKYPMASHLSVMILEIAHDYAELRGIIIPDSKFEFSGHILADEVLTPDSSRFWPADEWREGRKKPKGRKEPSSFDKDSIRKWLDGEIAKWQTSHGGVKMTPKNPEHVDAVHSFFMPADLIWQTARTYRYIFWRLTGMTIERYLRDVMKVQVRERPAKRVAVVCGSESDRPVIMGLISGIDPKLARINLHIMSCHRNPVEVREFAEGGCGGADVVICAGSKAFALPGVIDAIAHSVGQDVSVIGVALGEPGSKALEAAKLSIEEIPDATVITDEINGKVYSGESGFCDAMARVMHGEPPPVKPRGEKPVQMNVWKNY